MRKFDLIVIGSGSGLEVSADVSDAGWSVAIIEEGPFGGTCLNRGCIPSKMLIHCADVMQTIENVAAFGIHAKVESIDWQFIVGRYLLKHSANLEAAYASNNILEPDHQAAVDYHAMPHAVFASPQVASVGMTQQEAEGRGAAYVTSTYNYSDTAYGASIEDKDGFVKVLADPESGEILGCHMIGTDAATLIQEAANVMRVRGGVDAITQPIYVHPALPEVMQRAVGQLPV